MIRSRLVALFAAVAIMFSFAAPASAAYVGACGTAQNYSLVHLDRSGSYTAVEGTVIAAQVIPSCTAPGSGDNSSTYVLPANMSTSNTLVQLGYGRLSATSGATFVYTPYDDGGGGALGSLDVFTVPGHAFQWSDKYRFTITETDILQWRYRVENLTDGWSFDYFRPRHVVGSMTAVWYGVEVHNDWAVFGAQAPAIVQLTPLRYFPTGGAWTWLTGDTGVNWGCVGCIATPRSWQRSNVSVVGGYTSLNAWTTSH